jgi:hypothetical protein
LTEENQDKELDIIKATQRGTITLLIREYGRGTDFHCKDDQV